jgi:hypothetical protein
VLSLLIFVAIGLPAAVYAHSRIGDFVKGRSRAIAAHVIVLVVALSFGIVSAMGYGLPAPAWLVFLAGFGMVHIPPAVVLFIKRARHSPKS